MADINIDWGAAAQLPQKKQAAPQASKPGRDLDIAWPAARQAAGGIHAPTSINPGQTQKRISAFLEWAGDNPVAHAADAGLNADTRAGMAAFAGKNPVTQGIMDPAHATDLTHAAERNIGLPVAGEGAPWWQNVLQAGEDFGVETIGSPTTILTAGADLPFVAPLKAAQKIRDLTKYGLTIGAATAAVKAASKVSPVAKTIKKVADSGVGQAVGKVVDRAKSGVVEFHNERKDVTRSGENIVKGHEVAGKNRTRHDQQNYGDLIDTHRDVLNEIDEKRAAIDAEISDWMPAAKAGAATAVEHVAQLRKAREGLQALIPAPVRNALLQRAWREGTPQVRRQVEAKGYKPTADDQQVPVLNILHNFNDEYEPTQKLMSDEDRAVADQLRQPVTWIRQGDKAKFDLPKEGGTPDTPLADRILDRLVTGSRIENYHVTRRNILRDLGLEDHDPDIQRTLELIDHNNKIVEAGPTVDAAKFAQAQQREAELHAQLQQQLQAQKAAADLRAKHIKDDAVYAPQHVELRSPDTLQEEYLQHQAELGKPQTRIATVIQNGKRRQIVVPIVPRQKIKDTKRLQGKIVGLNSGVRNAELVARGARKAAATTDQQAQRFAGRVMSGTSDAQTSAARALGLAPDRSRLLDANGVPVKPPAPPKPEPPTILLPPQAAPPGKLLLPSGRPKGRVAGAKAALIKGPEAPKQAPPSLLDASGNPIAGAPTPKIIGKPEPVTGAQRKLAGINRHLVDLNQAAKRNAETAARPAQAHVINTEGRKTKQIISYEQHQRNLAEVRAENVRVANMNRHAKDFDTVINTVQIPQNLKQRLYGAIPSYNKNLFAYFSDLQRDALFVVPFAHMKNITVLTALGPRGLHTLKNGWAYAKKLRTDPDSLAADRKWLEETGASEHFLGDTDPKYRNIPKVGPALADFADKGNRALERYDEGMRLALRDTLRAKSPHASDFDIAGEIRDILGDYTNQAPMIRQLRDHLGANFPAWGLGVVPRAMTKAVREQPRRAQAEARLGRLISDDITEPAWGVDANFGDPLNDYSELWARPDKFLNSPSRAGVAGLAGAVGNAITFGEPGTYAGEEVARAIPGEALASNAINWPFPSNAPLAARAVGGLFNVYFPDKRSKPSRENQLARMGYKGPDIQRILQEENYEKEYAPTPPRASGGINIDWPK